MKSKAWFVAMVVVLCGPACGGDPGPTRGLVVPGGPAAPGGPGASSVMRAITAPEGEFLCEDAQGSVFSCVEPDTGERWVCKDVGSGDGASYHCVRDTGGASWTPPCDDYLVIGDGRAGLQCWDPPANYCKEGGSPITAWYCKPDGSLCCLSMLSNCFRCGWVRMTDCTVAGGGTLDEVACSALFASLAPEVRACVDGDGASDADCAGTGSDPECALDMDIVICP